MPSGTARTFYLLDDPSRDKHFHLYILQGLREAGFSPLVIYFRGQASRSLFASQGFPVLSLDLSTKLYKRFNPWPVMKLARLWRRFRPVVIHVQRHRPLIYTALALKLLRAQTPLLYTIRLSRLIRTWNRRLAFKYVSPLVTRVIAVSRGVGEDFLKRTGFPPERLVVIPNGLDPRPFDLPLTKQEARQIFRLPPGFLFGMVARFRKAKDHKGLIRAFAQIAPRAPEANLALVGDGPLEGELKQLVQEHGLEEKVVFTGRLSPSEIPKVLKAFDVFVHPTFREGMPAAILEAMAARLPIIATDAEGVEDIFETEREIGRLVPKGEVNPLAQAMFELYSLPQEKRKAMGEEAYQRLLEEFTHEKMIQRNVSLYREVLSLE